MKNMLSDSQKSSSRPEFQNSLQSGGTTPR